MKQALICAQWPVMEATVHGTALMMHSFRFLRPTTNTGEVRSLRSTAFQSNDALRSLPCTGLLNRNRTPENGLSLLPMQWQKPLFWVSPSIGSKYQGIRYQTKRGRSGRTTHPSLPKQERRRVHRTVIESALSTPAIVNHAAFLLGQIHKTLSNVRHLNTPIEFSMGRGKKRFADYHRNPIIQ